MIDDISKFVAISKFTMNFSQINRSLSIIARTRSVFVYSYVEMTTRNGEMKKKKLKNK